MRTRPTIFLALTLTLSVWAAPLRGARAAATATVAEAADPQRAEADQKAHASYARGEAAFKVERYAQALSEFEAGYAESPRPGFLLNIGHSWRKLGDLRKARATYKKYLLVEPTSQIADEVQALIAELDSAIAEEDRPPTRGPAPNHGGSAAPTAAPGTLPAALAVTPAAATPVLLSARDVSTTPGAAESPPSFYRRPWFWVAVAAVAVGAGAGFYALQSGSGDAFHASGNLGSLGSP